MYTLTMRSQRGCFKGEIDIAKEWFDSLTDKGVKPNIFSYTSLICGYCKNGKVDEAWRVFLEVPRRGLQHTTVTQINSSIASMLVDQVQEQVKYDVLVEVAKNLLPDKSELQFVWTNRLWFCSFSFIRSILLAIEGLYFNLMFLQFLGLYLNSLLEPDETEACIYLFFIIPELTNSE